MVAIVGHGLGIPNMGLLPIHHISFSHSIAHSSVNSMDILYIMPYLRRSCCTSGTTTPNIGLSAEPRIYGDFWFSSLSHLRGGSRNVRLLLSSPLHAATVQISQSLIIPKTSDSSTLRTSNMNPNSGGANELEPPGKPSKDRSPLVQFQALKLAGLKESLQSTKKRKVKHYTILAGRLAGEGHMLEFIKFLEVCVHSPHCEP